MASVTVFDSDRMLAIEQSAIVSGVVQGTNLHLITKGGTDIDAGNVQGPQGLKGDQGLMGGSTAQRNAYFGSPSTVADQVALANKAPVWFNTDNGYIEVYMAATGSAGLNYPGAAAAGWYMQPYMDKLPKGLLAIAEATADTAYTAAKLVALNIASFTFKANRNYRLEFNASLMGSATGQALAHIYSTPTAETAASTNNLTELTGFNLAYSGATTSIRAHLKRDIKYTVDTTLQIKAVLDANSTVNVKMIAGTTYPGQLTITDTGAMV